MLFRSLYVAATGAVCGELCYGSLQVERGAILDGRALKGESETKAVAKEPAKGDKKPAAIAQPGAPEAKRAAPPMPAGADPKVTTKVGIAAAG